MRFKNYHEAARLGVPFHIVKPPKPTPTLGNMVCPSCGAFVRSLNLESGWCSQCTHRFYLKDCR